MDHPPRTRSRLEAQAWHSRFTRRVVLPGARFIRISEIAGEPLLVATLVALLWANSPWSESYLGFWNTELALRLGSLEMAKTAREWVSDALMPLFFLVVGIDIKLEMVEGQLANWRNAALPIFAALGGMVAPALIYSAINLPGGTVAGWGVTVATDIAFALAILALLGDRVPRGARVLLLAFAVADDVGGILVIAVAYSEGIDWISLTLAAITFLLIHGLTRQGAVLTIPYVLLGLAAWGFVERSGVHPTIAGVILGLLVPTRARIGKAAFAAMAPEAMADFQDAFRSRSEAGRDRNVPDEAVEREDAALGKLTEMAEGTYRPAERLTYSLNPWVSYVVLPLFALASAGVAISPGALAQAVASPVTLGTLAGLVFGKPIGFIGAAWLMVRLGLARLPDRVGWPGMVSLGVLAGIGFTISLFIAELAFAGGEEQDLAKLGILAASIVSGLGGYALFRWWAAASDQEG